MLTTTSPADPPRAHPSTPAPPVLLTLAAALGLAVKKQKFANSRKRCDCATFGHAGTPRRPADTPRLSLPLCPYLQSRHLHGAGDGRTSTGKQTRVTPGGSLAAPAYPHQQAEARPPSHTASAGSAWQHSSAFVPLGPSAAGAATLLAAAAKFDATDSGSHLLRASSDDGSLTSAAPPVPLEALLGGRPLHLTLREPGVLTAGAEEGGDAPFHSGAQLSGALAPAAPGQAPSGSTEIEQAQHPAGEEGSQTALLRLLVELAGIATDQPEFALFI